MTYENLMAKATVKDWPKEILIRHDLVTGQKFYFRILRAEFNNDTIQLVTNGTIIEDPAK